MEGSNSSAQNNIPQGIDEGDGIDIQKWIFKIIKYWYWYVICVTIALGFAWFANKQISPIYNVGAVLLIDQDKQQNEVSMDNMLDGYGLGDLSNITNQMVMLQSYSLIKRTVEVMNTPIDYAVKSQFRWAAASGSSPITLIPVNIANRGSATFYISGNDNNSFTIRWEGDDIYDEVELTLPYDKEFAIGNMKLLVEKGVSFINQEIPETKVIYRSVDAIIGDYAGRLRVDLVGEKSSILNVSLTGENAQRDIEFIDMLISQFQESNLERKNDVAIKTMFFIEGQLNDIADSLDVAGKDLELFRSKNNIMDISSQVQEIITKTTTFEEQISRLEEQTDYLNFLQQYITEEPVGDNLVSPSTTGIQDAVLSALVNKYIDLQQNNAKISRNNNFYDVALKEMEHIRKAILEHSTNLLKSVDISKNRLNERLAEIEKESMQLPEIERELLTIQRKFDLNNNNYTYLLKKHSEAQILQASNASDIVLLDKARRLGQTDANKSKINFLIALVLGIGIPLGTQIVIEMLDNRVSDRKQLEQIAKMPVAAAIPHSSESEQPETVNKPESATSEAFRVIRLKLKRLKSKYDHGMAVMITSAMPNEGKSFVSINLAGSLAISGEKVILIGLDLRRPSLEKILQINHDKGIIEYLDGVATKKEILRKADDHIRFDLITTSAGRQDAGELMSDPKLHNLVQELKNEYDYVIIDIAPIGPTADPLAVDHLTETCLFLCRHKVGKLQFLEAAISDIKQSLVSNIILVANDVSYEGPHGKYAGRPYYGYYYGYGYTSQPKNLNDHIANIKTKMGIF